MAIKTGAKIVAHTRLAVETGGSFTLFVPGEIIAVGPVVSAEQAQDWLDRGSAGTPGAEDLAAWDAIIAARAAEAAAVEAAEKAAAKPGASSPPAVPAAE